MATTEQAEGSTKVSTPSDREIRVERELDAPLDQVWRAYTEPEQLARWWGRGNRVEIERFECVKGGHWRFVEHGPDGVHGFEGRMREVTPQQRLVQTFEWDGMPGYVCVNTATFQPVGDRTRVVTTMLFHTTEERDGMLHSGMSEGMAQSYVALDRLLAAEADVPGVESGAGDGIGINV